MGASTVVRLALLAASALLSGYLAYKGTRWHLSSFDLENQLSAFPDKYWSTYSTCPATGEVCVKTKCAPAVLRFYYPCKTRLVTAFSALPPGIDSPSSFGAYWVADSAAATILASHWFEGHVIEAALVYAAIPVILWLVLSRVCTPAPRLPESFSEEIPRMDDIEAFESAIHRYCLRLNSCAEIAEKAASETRLYHTYAAVLSAVMWGIVIAAVFPV